MPGSAIMVFLVFFFRGRLVLKSRADYKATPPPAMRAGNARKIFAGRFLLRRREKMCFSGRVVLSSVFVLKLRALGAHGVSSGKRSLIQPCWTK